MKNLNLTTGYPQVLNDYWLILQDNTKDALNLLLKQFGDSFILSGCGLSDVSGTLHIAAGVVFFDGQIMRVEAHTIATYSGSTIIAESYTSTITANPKNYGNGDSDVPMLTETFCRFKKRVAESSYVQLSAFKPFGAGIGSLLTPNFIVAEATSVGGYTLAAGVNFDLDGGATVSVGDRLKFRKTIDGRLLVSGGVGYNSYANSATVNGIPFCSLLCTVDAAFRPEKAVYFANYNGSVAGAYANQPVLGESFVLFPDGKLCIQSKVKPASELFKIQNIQIIL